jgi:hypothetical protein
MFKNIYIRNSLLASAALLAAGFGIAYVSLKDVEHLLVVHFVLRNEARCFGNSFHRACGRRAECVSDEGVLSAEEVFRLPFRIFHHLFFTLDFNRGRGYTIG